jgi:DnaJ-class molecular chaperone
MDKSTRREFVVSIADHLTWKLAWEQKNNRCYRCTGTGQTLARVSIADGETYQPCSRCHGEKTARP